jgi:hypothetical protein
MQIEITYLFRNSKDSQTIKLNPEEYFDPLLLNQEKRLRKMAFPYTQMHSIILGALLMI